MKRLQVGDECYVRRYKTGEIVKCIYIGTIDIDICDDNPEWIHAARPENQYGTIALSIGKGSLNKIVYPFPCIKELAV